MGMGDAIHCIARQSARVEVAGELLSYDLDAISWPYD
jgi:hypothetical protein